MGLIGCDRLLGWVGEVGVLGREWNSSLEVLDVCESCLLRILNQLKNRLFREVNIVEVVRGNLEVG